MSAVGWSPFTVVKVPLGEAKVRIGKLLPPLGVKPFTNRMFKAPASVAEPVMASTSYWPPAAPPSSMFRTPALVCV